MGLESGAPHWSSSFPPPHKSNISHSTFPHPSIHSHTLSHAHTHITRHGHHPPPQAPHAIQRVLDVLRVTPLVNLVRASRGSPLLYAFLDGAKLSRPLDIGGVEYVFLVAVVESRRCC